MQCAIFALIQTANLKQFSMNLNGMHTQIFCHSGGEEPHKTMKKVDRFIGKNSLNKTLRFSLIPQGRTEDNFYDKLLLQDDEERAAAYTCVKEYLDRYHRAYIEGILSELSLRGVEAYADIYYKKNKSTDEMKELEKRESDLRKEISNALTDTQKYKNFKKEDMIKQELPSVLLNDEERKNVDKFKGFTTYFTGFHKNRENMYSAEANSTAISYRCINDNLPRFLDNAVSFAKLRQAIPSELRELNADLGEIYGIEAEHIFDKSAFSSALSQSEIDRYNCYIGGYSCDDGSKIRGLNEYVNLYNQKLGKTEGSQRLPLLKPLYKQILTRSETVSFLPDKFDSDNEMLSAVSKFFTESALPTLNGIESVFEDFSIFDASGIFVCAASLPELSNRAFEKWSFLGDSWRTFYSQSHPLKRGENEERYYDKLEKQFKTIKSFSLKELSELVPYGGEESKISSFVEFYKEEVRRAIEKVRSSYEAAQKLLGEDYEKTHSKKLRNDLAAVELIKSLLDNAKELLKVLKSLLGSGKEENKDNAFYGVFLPLCEGLYELDKLYDKVRNYVTAKPSAIGKIKLNFGIPTLLDGWDVNKQADNKSVLLLKDSRYYLAIMDKTNGKLLENAPPANGLPCYKKVDIKYIPSVAKYFSIKQIRPQNPPDNIIKYLTPGFDKSKMTKDELVELISYVAEDFIPNYDSLKKKDGSCYFNFKFKAYRDYNSWKKFCDDIEKQAYTVSYSSISEDFVNEKLESGELYLFQIYCKDFSERKKGENTKNLHTLYFEMLFNEENLADTVYQINGGAEMFYRKAAINKSEAVIHRANEAIPNKNPLNENLPNKVKYFLKKNQIIFLRCFLKKGALIQSDQTLVFNRSLFI